MVRRHDRRIAVIIGALLLGVCTPATQSWGQAADRIGTVLVVEGEAEVQAAQATVWERLRFRDLIFLNDTVRTGVESKVKVLLRDDSIMTLGEQSEMRFTEFLVTEQQRRTGVNLLIGKLRVLTTRFFGGGSLTEVRTPNAVAGVRGTNSIHTTAPSGDAHIVQEGGPAEVRSSDPTITAVVTVLAGQGARVIRAAPPQLYQPSRAEMQAVLRETNTAPAQVGKEVKTEEQLKREPSQPIRGAQPGGTPGPGTQPGGPPGPGTQSGRAPGPGTQSGRLAEPPGAGVPLESATVVVRDIAPVTDLAPSPILQAGADPTGFGGSVGPGAPGGLQMGPGAPEETLITPDTAPTGMKFIDKARANVTVNFPQQ